MLPEFLANKFIKDPQQPTSMEAEHDCNRLQQVLLRRVQFLPMDFRYLMVRQSDLILILNLINFVFKHLSIGKLPKEYDQSKHWQDGDHVE